jgi:hypothetical protein
MLTQERIDAIFEEMDGYTLELASEPSMLGPQYFQDIIAKCRGHLNKVSLVISELNRDKLATSSELRKSEALYELEYDNLIANDEQVKRLANIEDRRSTANYLLRTLRQKINTLKDSMHALESVYKVVSHRNRELHATMNAIKDQRRLVTTEISTGAFYGDERVPRSQREPREPIGNMMAVNDAMSEVELEALMSDVSTETPETPATTATSEPDPETSAVVAAPPAPEPIVQEKAPVAEHKPTTEVPGGSLEEDIVRFLESPTETPTQAVVVGQKSDADEFEDLFASL